jgi:hypothetical protein
LIAVRPRELTKYEKVFCAAEGPHASIRMRRPTDIEVQQREVSWYKGEVEGWKESLRFEDPAPLGPVIRKPRQLQGYNPTTPYQKQ